MNANVYKNRKGTGTGAGTEEMLKMGIKILPILVLLLAIAGLSYYLLNISPEIATGEKFSTTFEWKGESFLMEGYFTGNEDVEIPAWEGGPPIKAQRFDDGHFLITVAVRKV